jgi:hypothetical protein
MKKKLKQMYVKIASYLANKAMIILLAKGDLLMGEEGRALWQSTFDTKLKEIVEKDGEELENILGLDDFIFSVFAGE